MDDMVPHESASRRAILRQSNSEGAERIQPGARFWIAAFSMGQEWVNIDGQSHRRKRTGPASSHSVRDGDAHGIRGGETTQRRRQARNLDMPRQRRHQANRNARGREKQGSKNRGAFHAEEERLVVSRRAT
jgi:hypothetical protein